MIMPISPISTRVIIWESMFLKKKKNKTHETEYNKLAW